MNRTATLIVDCNNGAITFVCDDCKWLMLSVKDGKCGNCGSFFDHVMLVFDDGQTTEKYLIPDHPFEKEG